MCIRDSTIDGSNLGQVLKVTVTAPDGNNCWGHILVEDKYGPQLECSDVYTTCVGDLTPGSAMSDRINVPGFSVNNILLPGAPNSKTFTIPVTGFSDINISNVGVHLNISHTRVSDLVATVKAPDGNMVTLSVSPGANAGPCTGDNAVSYTHLDVYKRQPPARPEWHCRLPPDSATVAPHSSADADLLCR